MLQLTTATYKGRSNTTWTEQHTKEDITLPTYYSWATTNGFFCFLGLLSPNMIGSSKKLVGILRTPLYLTYVPFFSKFWFLWRWRAIFMSAGCGRPQTYARQVTRRSPPRNFFLDFFHDNSSKLKKLKVTKNRYIIFY